MEKNYFVIVEKEKNSCYGVYSPDFKTCGSFGDTFEQAVENMKKAMELCLENMNKIPDASPVSAIEKFAVENYPKDSVKIICSINVSLPKAKSVRINITMPDDILALLDEAVSGRKNARSRFITEAVRERLSIGAGRKSKRPVPTY